MKPILYEANEKDFTSNGIGVLNDCIECICEEERNGMFECSLVYPISGQFYSYIKNDRIILVKASALSTRKLQPFRIYKITKPINGKVSVYARHVSYQLNDILVAGFTANSPSEVFNLIPQNAIDDIGRFTFTYDGPSNPTNYAGVDYETEFYASIRSRLGGSEGSVLDIWHGEYEWDVWDVILHENRGENRGVVFSYGKDITDMTQESDIGEIITRVLPYCRFVITNNTETQAEEPATSYYDDELSDGTTQRYTASEDYNTYEAQQEEIIVTIDGLYVDAGTISAYSYPRTAMLDFSNEIDNELITECINNARNFSPIKNILREKATAYIALQGMPKENNTISFIPPEDIVELCDHVRVENEALNVSVTTEINKVTYDVLLEEYVSVEIGDLKTDFTDAVNSGIQNNASNSSKNQMSLEVDILKANSVITDQLTAQNAKIAHLVADTAIIKDLIAERAHIADLHADRADIGELRAAVAEIGEAKIGYAEIGDLVANHASITNLEAVYANIQNLLAGNAVTGDLTSIHLTAVNSVIDQEVARNLVSQFAIINNLISGRIATGQIDTLSDVGGIRVVGNTIQVFEKNGNTETVRMQIGKDGNGNFTFLILGPNGPDGQKVLIDETGIHSSGIPNGVIVNDMVAQADSSTGYSGISASKLDINDVSTNIVTNINGDPTKTISSTQIYFDNDNKTLNAMWAEMSTRVVSAENAARSATDALSGIDTLSSVNMVLTNDTAIVQTDSSGVADYTGCSTEAKLYYGSVDITLDTTHVSNWRYTKSAGISGSWMNVNVKSFTVTGMTVDSGYVEISADYTLDSEHDPITLTKRFNIIKLDYNIETPTSYFLRVDPKVISRKADGTWSTGIKMMRFRRIGSDVTNTGTGTKLRLSYSTDGGVNYTSIRTLTTTAATAGYSPSSALNVNTNRFKIELLETANDDRVVDTEIIHVASDAGEIKDSLQTLSTDYASTVTGPNGLVTRVGGAETDIQGVTNSLNKMLLYNITHLTNNNNTTTLYAHVWKEGIEITSSFAANQFEWFKRDDSGETLLGTGSSITVNNSDFVYSGVVVGRFTIDEEG